MSLAISLLALFLLTALGGGLLASLAGRGLEARALSTSQRAALSIAPLVLSTTACLALIWPGLTPAGCHCLTHGLHHPHLCLRHPEYAAGAALPAALVLAAWAFRGLPRFGSLLQAWWQTERWTRRVAKVGARASGAVIFRLIDAPGLGACTTGLFSPLIAIDIGLWRRLNDDERLAVLQHEEAHRARRDPLTLLVLKACAAFTLLPGAARFERNWLARVEEECDRHAAEVVGSPEAVASALLSLERYHRDAPRNAPLLGASAGTGALELRVRRLLDGQRQPQRANLGSDVLAVALVGFAAAVLLTWLGADFAHHGAETALGLLIDHR